MAIAEKTIKYSVLHGLVPLDALSNAHLNELANKAIVEEISADQYVFRAGDQDNQTVYLLDGTVELINAQGKSVGNLAVKSETAKHPLAHAQPRQLSVRATGKVSVVRIDSSQLDALLAWSESTGYDVEEITAGSDGDWLTRLLQSATFSRLSPVNIQQLLSSMESMPVLAGDLIVEEGSAGEYFYVVKKGRLSVTRKGAVQDKDVLLAELSDGACFGEEALVAGTQRNATVTMLTDGVVMRVSKQDFDELLRTPLVQSIEYISAKAAIDEGAQWLDVRLTDEFKNCSLPESLNLPLSELRNHLDGLDQQSKYIICCDTGRRSATAAFVLSQHGFDATVLNKGLLEVPWEDLLGDVAAADEIDATEKPDSMVATDSVAESAAQTAVIRDFQEQIEQLDAKNNRLVSELESAQLELRHQTDEIGKALKASQEDASDLDTARMTLARAQNEKQNILKEQTRLTQRVRKVELENKQLRKDYQHELERTGGSATDVDARVNLVHEHSDALLQVEQLTNDLTKLKAKYKQTVDEKKERIVSLEESLESEREVVQQQLDELTASAEAESKRQLADMQAMASTHEGIANEAGQKIDSLQSQLEQMAGERATHETALQQASQDADKLRAEFEVNRGLGDMLPETSGGELQATVNQLKVELDAETAQRVLADQEVSRWKAEAKKQKFSVEAAADNSAETPVVSVPVLNHEPDDLRFTAYTPEVKPASATPPINRLIEDEEAVTSNGFIGKLVVFLVIGAVAAAAALYWWPNFNKQAELQSIPDAAVSNESAADHGGTASEIAVDMAEPPETSVQEAAPITQDEVQVSLTVAETVAAIEALEATADTAEQEFIAPEPKQASAVSIKKMKPGKLFSDRLANGRSGPRMVQMPTGAFTMGSAMSSANFNERPRHEVTLSTFAMGKYEVTFEEYDQFARMTGRGFPSDAGWGRGRQPVINISWNDALAYTQWLSKQSGFNYRLPTEAEWEYAARAGTITHYWWSNKPNAEGKANCFNCGSKWDAARPAAVGSLPANAVGIHEISGNVMEWVQDCYLPDYKVASTVGAAVNLTPCDAHVVRGGSYSGPVNTLRSAARSRRVPQSQIDNLGFRVVRAN
jgi:formylglycine-generating enzyme required for sulfatase activity/CRP-like cAMP-binding protein